MSDGEDNDPDWLRVLAELPKAPSQGKGRDWLDLLNDANSYLSLHLAFTYLFTFLALRFIYKMPSTVRVFCSRIPRTAMRKTMTNQ